MAESYSVKAILSAKDSGFSSTFNKCTGAVDKINGKLNGISFGVLAGVGQKAFGMITNSVSGLVGEINESNLAWKTFEGNMSILGKDAGEVAKAKKELQAFAEQSIYSSSDMANTYAQLAAVGVKSADKLVKGFGGLAAASENPRQAMKTLSQQGTQMAGKPMVAWQDFKLMMEQTPAGMASVAKAMGMTMSELVGAIQGGEVATQDFFAAVEAVGNSDGFAGMATQYKSAGQAMGGLTETIGNKLIPVFEVLNQTSIGSISGLADALGKIDGQALADKLSKGIQTAEKYWNAFTEAFSGTGTELMEAFNAIKTSFTELTGSFGSTESVEGFKGMMESVANGIKMVADFVTANSDKIAWIIANLPKILIAMKGFSIAKSIGSFLSPFATGIGKIATSVGGGLAEKLGSVSEAQEAVGTASASTGKNMLTSAGAFALMGVAVLTISAGFALLAQSAIALANSGGLAIGVMAGLVVAVAGLGAGMGFLLAFLAPMSAALMPVATALLAVSAAVVLVGAGVLLASAGIALIASQLPMLAQHGMAGATAITALGGALVVFAAGAAVAGVGIVALSVGIVAFGAAALVASAGVLVFGAGMLVASAGTLVMGAALTLVASQMKNIASNAKTTQASLKSMNSSVKAVESGLNALGSKAKTAMKALTSAFDNTAKKAKTAGKDVGTGFSQGVQSGLARASAAAVTMTNAVVVALKAGRAGAYSAGSYIGQGLAQGMASQLAYVRSVAAQLASAAEAAIRAEAKIHSPSKVSEGLGEYWGEGYVNGLLGMVRSARLAAQRLVTIPNVAVPAFAGDYQMSSDFDYYRNNEFVIEVPLAVDGREFARATATYTQSELNRNVRRDNRKRGKA